MKLSEIYGIANAIAPKALSDEYCERYGAYDNSGVLVDCGKDITGVLFSLDLSDGAIDRAIATGKNLIVTHHPAIYGKIGEIAANDRLGGKLIRCIERGISVLSMHLNLDCATDGIDEWLKKGVCKATDTQTCFEEKIMHPLSDGGYGRAYLVKGCILSRLCAKMKEEFNSERIICYGKTEKEITRVASFCGAGADEEALAFAKQNGAELVISSDFKHHLITLALESGMAVMILPHYASENYGFKKYYEKICRQIEVPCEYHTDNILL